MKDALKKEHAYLEINLDNLEYNLKNIQSYLSKNTKVMAIVKANAYGHGAVQVSKKLNSLGIFDFAVATLEEGIELRENNIQGNILILGYTSIENIKYVIQYDLIQTIIDKEYAVKLSDLPFAKEVKVHLKINTGMNRLGISYKEIDFIKKLYQSNKLNILGIYSHMCVADSKTKSDIAFSKAQIKRYNLILEELKKAGINPGKTHLQSSYGIINYNDLSYDYVRPGIILYGVNSSKDAYLKNPIKVRPVLSLKSTITSIREISSHETVGYGRKYKANSHKKIATVSIGYADGYPRNLSCQEVAVIVNNHPAHIIGRICMDQLIIDVSSISSIQVGDTVTLIGDDKRISVEQLAKKSKTITNEILSSLGSRLHYIYIEDTNKKQS